MSFNSKITPSLLPFIQVQPQLQGVWQIGLDSSQAFLLPYSFFDFNTNYSVTITGINYTTRTLTTSGPLPPNPAVMAGNAGRRIHLQLKGSGTTYTWDDDLLIHEGRLTTMQVTGANSATITSSQSVLFGDVGNRKTASLTVITEDGQWHFRGGQVVRKPTGATLTASVFTDANGDGLTNVKTYEIGIGDSIDLPADITLKREGSSYLALANAPVSGTIQGNRFSIPKPKLAAGSCSSPSPDQHQGGDHGAIRQEGGREPIGKRSASSWTSSLYDVPKFP